MTTRIRAVTELRALACKVTLAAAVAAAPLTATADSIGEPGRDSGKRNPLKNVYFGDEHLHSAESADAFAFGTRQTADAAYRYNKGEPIKHDLSGKMIQKKTPYDFTAVTNHDVYLGVLPMLLDPTNPLQQTEIGKLISSGDHAKGEAAFKQMIMSASAGSPVPYLVDPKVQADAWKAQVAAANKHNEPGKFSTLVAYEWTSQPNAKNLHHNVFFRDNGPDKIFSAFDSVHREDLWTYQEEQRKLGHENFSIPHNSNVSNSAMFALHTSNGDPIDKRWAERSARNSPAIEIVQTKGASETHPALSPNDEFAGFESSFTHLLGSGGVLGLIDKSFVRNALIDGVGFQEMIGANPFKYGIVGGTDSHIAASSNEEFNYDGVHNNIDYSPEVRLSGAGSVAGEPAVLFGSGGVVAVWAPENTREEIFDGIARRETYGTSGPLMRVRFFGGWDYPDNLVKDRKFVEKAYKTGVPMGSDLPAMPKKAKAPTFAVWALKDPNSGNLDRIQIIKGWYDKRGYGFQKIYNVAWSDGRKLAKNGKLPAVGNTVDIPNASYTNSIGDNELMAVWTDPAFNPADNAVYYARVIEIPTPRWSTYDAKTLGVPVPEGVDATIQERAWSSPIWYTAGPEHAKKLKFYPGLQERLPPSGTRIHGMRHNEEPPAGTGSQIHPAGG